MWKLSSVISYYVSQAEEVHLVSWNKYIIINPIFLFNIFIHFKSQQVIYIKIFEKKKKSLISQFYLKKID